MRRLQSEQKRSKVKGFFKSIQFKATSYFRRFRTVKIGFVKHQWLPCTQVYKWLFKMNAKTRASLCAMRVWIELCTWLKSELFHSAFDTSKRNLQLLFNTSNDINNFAVGPNVFSPIFLTRTCLQWGSYAEIWQTNQDFWTSSHKRCNVDFLLTVVLLCFTM